MNKQLTYGYDRSGMTHQPRVIYDGTPELPYELYWDANGNLAQIIQCDYNEVRFHEWDDNNRLRAVIGPNQAGFYGYDGNGDRVWKLMGKCSLTSQNGGKVSYSTLLDDAVLYPNPYLTITPTGYTKHYYIGSERIATAVGEGGWSSAIKPLIDDEIKANKEFFEHYKDLSCEKYSWTKNVDLQPKALSELQYHCGPKCLEGVEVLSPYDLLRGCINYYMQPTGNTEKPLFTHSDHLGSASWITYSGGYPVQYIHYAPYGELMANQKTSSFDERYKFTGKERDAESGYYYHGARFLLSDAGIWLSVDPLVDKYIHLSPYMYCNGNPIKYIDPDGRIVVFAPGTTTAQKEMFWKAVRYLNSHNCGGRYGQLKNSSQKYIINMNAGKGQFDGRTDRENPVIYWEPNMGYETDNGTILSPATVLNHEFTHATHFDDAKNKLDAGDVEAWNKYAQTTNEGTSEAYGSKEEESVITGIEQRTAQALGEVEPGKVTRTNHGGKPVPVEDSTSNKKIVGL